MYNHCAMLLNIVNAKNHEGSPVEFSVNVELANDLLESKGYELVGEAEVTGTMCYENRRLTTEAKGKVKINAFCDACAKPLEKTLVFDVNEEFVSADEQSEEQYTLNLANVDLQKAVEDNLLLTLPTKLLCKEDCKGLCPHCGKDLNNHVCNCEAIMESEEQLDNPFNKLSKLGED